MLYIKYGEKPLALKYYTPVRGNSDNAVRCIIGRLALENMPAMILCNKTCRRKLLAEI